MGTAFAQTPSLEVSASPETIAPGQSATIAWTSEGLTVLYAQDFSALDLNGSMVVSPTETTTYLFYGFYYSEHLAYSLIEGSVTVTVSDTLPAPTVNFDAAPSAIKVGESTTLSWTTTNADSVTIEPGIGSVALSGSQVVSPTEPTTYTISATGPGGAASDQALVTVSANVPPQPEGSFGAQYEDLIPHDATTDAYDPKRFSLITGKVEDLSGAPLEGVTVSVNAVSCVQCHGQEYGTVKTNAQGSFTIPTEGGDTQTVVYNKAGLLTSHRQVYVPWNDTAIAETVQMIPQDTAATTLTFDGNPETVVTHQSAQVSDESGSRSATMVFTGDNRAYSVDAGGNVIQELTTITTRATEFTTPESMPAVLPPTSAYTYCAEFSVDGAERVRFDKPVISWVDNFLGFDVGMAVPVGYYDRDRGVWVPSDNGVVVRLLDTNSDGLVDALDSNGDNLPNDLNGDGAFSDEVLGLNDPAKYPVNSTFWRFSVTHFTPWDCNWPYGPPDDSIPPNPDGKGKEDKQDDKKKPLPCSEINSFVEDRSRIFHEDIPIPGTNLTLHYSSNRVKGYRTKFTVPASGSTVPASLQQIIVRVWVAGQFLESVLPPLPDQKAEFLWDGNDHLGRPVVGSAKAHVSVGFVYDAVYYVPADDAQAFLDAGIDPTRIPTRQRSFFWKDDYIWLHPKQEGEGTIAEGWTLSSHHHLSPRDPGTLIKGDGSISKDTTTRIDTIAGNGTAGYSGDGGIATSAQLDSPRNIAVDAAGNLYIADGCIDECGQIRRIRKVDTNGIITTIAGNSGYGFSGDGGPATEAGLDWPEGMAVDAAGNLYIADAGNHRIRMIDVNGIITTVAGNGTAGFSGDGDPATEAQLWWPTGLAVDAAGNLYISTGPRVRKVDTNGIITTVAGNGTYGDSGDGGPATEAQLRGLDDLAVDNMGNLYIADASNHRIRKVNTSGIITTVAGNGTQGNSGDGSPATEAQLWWPTGLAVDAAGNLFISDYGVDRIRMVDTSGIIKTIAGSGAGGYSGEGGPATRAKLNYPESVTVDTAGNLYISDSYNHRIRKVANRETINAVTSIDDFSFAEENGQGHILSNTGLHKKTIDLNTGLTLREFGYNADGNLETITDQFGNVTRIVWTNGVPTTITSSDNITTQLTIDPNTNHLTHVTFPDQSYYSFEYNPDGLMTVEIDPETNRFEHLFDSVGRLTDVLDPESGHWAYTRTAQANGDILVQKTTAEGNVTTYLDHTFSTGAYNSTVTEPSGGVTTFSSSADGLSAILSLSCGTDLAYNYDLDPEYGFRFVKEMTKSTPAGLLKTILTDKSYQDTNSDELPDLITETVTVNGKAQTFETNTLLAKKLLISPEGRTVSTLYDPNNLVTSKLSIPGLLDTDYGHDAKGRLTTVTTGERQTTLTYDPVKGFLKTVTDLESPNPTTYDHDDLGRITAIHRPDGTTVGLDYDNNGNMTLLVTPNYNANHIFGHNKVGLKSLYQTPLSGSYSYLYDRDRRLTEVHFPSGKLIKNFYANGRLDYIQTPEGNINFSYLCATKVGTVSKGGETITYGYDGPLVTSETFGGILNQGITYGYNNEFNLKDLTYAGGTTSYSYDNDGLLTGAGSFTITRKPENGLPETVSDTTFSLGRTFNGYGEVDAENTTVGAGTPYSYNLIRDRAGRITTKTETVDGVTNNYVYGYDAVGRLKTVNKNGTLVEEYRYEDTGIPTYRRTYEMNALRGIAGRNLVYDDEDHLQTVGDTTYQHDLDGFLTSKTQGTDVTQYDYSSRGELLSVTLPDSTVIEYINDPQGRRIAKKVNGAIVEKYLWQGLTRLLAVYDGSDTLLIRFQYADGRMPVAMTKGATTYYLGYDQVGSLKVVVDTTGNVVKKLDYDSFGNVIADSNPAFTVPFGFAGGLHDRDTGLVRFGHRDYDPETGRWAAKDPIFFDGGDVDLYGYVVNNPVSLIDPNGESAFGEVALIKLIKAINSAHPFPLELLNPDPYARVLIKGNPITGACAGELLTPTELKDPYLGDDGNWHWPDGTPLENGGWPTDRQK